eukprot:TRINITY_DN34038_c0_g1_i1.p1 TRINITY_DN34038_c0_g1~~TRINITY_DN34038_c0_g1_i1.p1  ORF type:complete len:869 (+),score=144.21 TRINITY_DN34038_c0_g1_i1:38-2644(+)
MAGCPAALTTGTSMLKLPGAVLRQDAGAAGQTLDQRSQSPSNWELLGCQASGLVGHGSFMAPAGAPNLGLRDCSFLAPAVPRTHMACSHPGVLGALPSLPPNPCPAMPPASLLSGQLLADSCMAVNMAGSLPPPVAFMLPVPDSTALPGSACPESPLVGHVAASSCSSLLSVVPGMAVLPTVLPAPGSLPSTVLGSAGSNNSMAMSMMSCPGMHPGLTMPNLQATGCVLPPNTGVMGGFSGGPLLLGTGIPPTSQIVHDTDCIESLNKGTGGFAYESSLNNANHINVADSGHLGKGSTLVHTAAAGRTPASVAAGSLQSGNSQSRSTSGPDINSRGCLPNKPVFPGSTVERHAYDSTRKKPDVGQVSAFRRLPTAARGFHRAGPHSRRFLPARRMPSRRSGPRTSQGRQGLGHCGPAACHGWNQATAQAPFEFSDHSKIQGACRLRAEAVFESSLLPTHQENEAWDAAEEAFEHNPHAKTEERLKPRVRPRESTPWPDAEHHKEFHQVAALEQRAEEGLCLPPSVQLDMDSDASRGVAATRYQQPMAMSLAKSRRREQPLVLIWHCKHPHGLFSMFSLAMGHMETCNQQDIALIVDWSGKDLLYQGPQGEPNLWTAFFQQPAELAFAHDPQALVQALQQGHYMETAKHDNVFGCYKGVIQEYGGITPKLAASGRALCRRNLIPCQRFERKLANAARQLLSGGHRWLAVHVRRSDKGSEAQVNFALTDLDIMFRIEAQCLAWNCDAVFLCTDDAALKQRLCALLATACSQAIRTVQVFPADLPSDSKQAAHFDKSLDAYKKAEDVMLEAMLMARGCHGLLSTYSNVSASVVYLSPDGFPYTTFWDAVESTALSHSDVNPEIGVLSKARS